MCESDYQAKQRKGKVITREDVDAAIAAAIRRLDQFRERSHESILRDIQLVDTRGCSVAQVNGLTVYQLGNYAFGRPARVTATARLGAGRVVDIEREVKLGGRIHSKGVMIISSLLANRYARNRPLPLSCTLTFEQSYGGVEGDSASIAEFTALLSALTGLPVRQDLAVTGSLNQHGQVQAIGGINEKIEGFFDICNARGLTGDQGVVMPLSNRDHLMLRADVVAAVESDNFHIYAVSTIDEALTLLLGVEAGESDDEGLYPANSVNGKAMARVEALIALSRTFSQTDKSTPDNEDQGRDDE
jgi:predicted ATP-dependent protease